MKEQQSPFRPDEHYGNPDSMQSHRHTEQATQAEMDRMAEEALRHFLETFGATALRINRAIIGIRTNPNLAKRIGQTAGGVLGFFVSGAIIGSGVVSPEAAAIATGAVIATGAAAKLAVEGADAAWPVVAKWGGEAVRQASRVPEVGMRYVASRFRDLGALFDAIGTGIDLGADYPQAFGNEVAKTGSHQEAVRQRRKDSRRLKEIERLTRQIDELVKRIDDKGKAGKEKAAFTDIRRRNQLLMQREELKKQLLFKDHEALSAVAIVLKGDLEKVEQASQPQTEQTEDPYFNSNPPSLREFAQQVYSMPRSDRNTQGDLSSDTLPPMPEGY